MCSAPHLLLTSLPPASIFSEHFLSLSLPSPESSYQYMSNLSSDGSHTQLSGASRVQAEHQFEQETVSSCEAIIEEFRRGKVSKADTSIRLLEAIKYQDAGTEEEVTSKCAAYSVFFSELEEVESTSRDAAHRGEMQLPDPIGDDAPDIEPTEGIADSVDAGSKRKRNADEDNTDKARKVNESLFPFSKSRGTTLLPPDLQLTLKLKENYTRDLAVSKQRILCHPDCPNVPEAIWNDVLSSRYVDLDKIFTAFYTVDGDHKQTLKLGDLKVISGGSSRPGKHVARHSDWTNAWVRYQEAIFFAFPHQANELRDYAAHINESFIALPESQASKVLNYDRAVRSAVGRSNRLLLTDLSSFNHFYTMHIVMDL
ncbi:hypothetical protein SCP_1702670 [Sparassis crispa]|uniref:Uncharacterized protein n=1 Tax=Sparassis crispa TaxID=139825 RepID=A0A401H6D1_9APHY|nr:hypothetical protein SCP_1702670 [Sparassis crispa]GBE89941.1 hypothetical protein SCP_1702670 [Sparassis crispa]